MQKHDKYEFCKAVDCHFLSGFKDSMQCSSRICIYSGIDVPRVLANCGYQITKRHNEEYDYAKSLCLYLWEKFYQKESPAFEPLDNLFGVLSQIDNMITGLTKKQNKDG